MRTDIAGGTILSWNGNRWVAISNSLISEWTLGSTGTTGVTFSSIPQYWRHLRMIVSAKCLYNGSGGGFGEAATSMTFNGDTGNNYVVITVTNVDSTTTAVGGMFPNVNSMNPLPILAPTSAITSPVASGGVIDIPHYTVSGSRHYAISTGMAASAPTDAYLSTRGNAWSGTQAITSITFGWGGNSVYAGASVSLYGVA